VLYLECLLRTAEFLLAFGQFFSIIQLLKELFHFSHPLLAFEKGEQLLKGSMKLYQLKVSYVVEFSPTL
jgi:hypothetical protein